MAKKSNKGAADDIALMALSGTGSDLDSWLSKQGIGDNPATTLSVAAEAPKETSEQELKASQAGAKAQVELVEKVKQEENVVVTLRQEESTKQEPASGKTGKQRERYEGQFFKRIEGFKKPTNMMYMSEKTYRLLTFLLRSSKESNTKITMPEVLENIIAQHIKDNESTLNQMQQEHLERLSKGF